MSNKSKDDFRNWMYRNVDLRIENENRDMPTKGSIEDIENRTGGIMNQKMTDEYHKKKNSDRAKIYFMSICGYNI